MLTRNLIVAALLGIANVTLPFSAGLAQGGGAVFSAGEIAFREGDYLRALAYFDDARNAGIQGPAVHYNIAVCHYRLNHYEQAEREFRLLAERFPKNAGARQLQYWCCDAPARSGK